MKTRTAAAAVLGLAAVVLTTVLVSTAFSGADRSEPSSPSCSNSGWATTAEGRPSALSSGGGRSVFVWRDGKGWHVWTRGGSRSSPLTGAVLANSQLRVVGASPAMRSGLKTQARSITMRVAAGQLATLDFASRCASRLNFRFGAAQTAPTASGAPATAGSGAPALGSQASLPQVFLGKRGTAPAQAFRLQRPASTGVAGRILLRSQCPVGGADTCPPPQPTQGTVRIETAAGKGGGSGQVVARVRSDENGRYSADLAAGRYQLIVEKSGGYPVAKPSVADVETGVVTQVDVYLDSGIR